jgi:thioredoxin 1
MEPESTPIILSDETFNIYVSNPRFPVLVDFWAEWCHPCKMMEPIVQQFSDRNRKIQVAKLNIDENPEISKQFQIFSIPTMILFNKGMAVKRLSGVHTLHQLEMQLSAFLN